MKKLIAGVILLGILSSCGNKKTNIDPFASITKEVDSVRQIADSSHHDKSPEDPQPIQADESFDDFIRYRKGDLRNCDLSGILECDKDFSVYIVNETTKLPISTYTNITYSVKKYYDNKKFHVTQKWINDSGLVLK